VRRVGLLLLVVVLVGGACSSGGGGSSDGDRANPEEGDVFLDPFGEVGTNPFTNSVALAAVPPVDVANTDRSDQGLSTVRGTTSALYAAAPGQQICDASAAINELADNDDKGQAWVDALNDDPQLSWSGGSKLAADDVPAYVAELTSVFLRSDTRVTSHGFESRHASPFQSVLQHGTAVLIDTRGVPRARCAGFNPLSPPKPAAKPKYHGEEWDGFDKTKLVIVQPGSEADSFRVLDVHTKTIVEIPAGQRALTIATTTTTEPFDEETTTTVKTGKTTTTLRRVTTTTGKPTTTVPVTTTTPATTVPATTTTTV
jgi:hypothetical protein